MSDKQQRSQFAAKISDGNENITRVRENPLPILSVRRLLTPSSFSLKFRIRSAATAVSIIMLDDRPDRSLPILVKIVLLLQFSPSGKESGGLSRDEILVENHRRARL